VLDPGDAGGLTIVTDGTGQGDPGEEAVVSIPAMLPLVVLFNAI
jgi:hypothetical protein